MASELTVVDIELTRTTRFLILLAGIVAIAAMSVGIKDYLQEKEAKPATTSTPAVAHSNTTRIRKKTASGKTRQARMSATHANASATEQAAADNNTAANNSEKPLTSEEFLKAGGNAVLVIDNARNTGRTQSARDEADAATERTNRAREELNTLAACETATPGLCATKCLPLPNLTKPGDVDAFYYENWAREYSCLFLP